MSWQGDPYGYRSPAAAPLVVDPTVIEPPRRRSRGGLVGLFAVAAILFLGFAVALAAGVLVHRPLSTGTFARPGTAATRAPASPVAPVGGALDADRLAAQIDPAIVDINTTLGYQRAKAAGTGVVLTASGVVLTNNHVIAGATEITAVDVGDGRTYQVTVLGYDEADDIAVVQLDGAAGLAVAPTGDSSSVVAGAAVLALGNAGGVGGTPSAAPGTVLDTDQTITATDESGASERLTGLIEVAADIQPGDSGGPLVSADGHVIGIDTAASAGFRYQAAGGRGFAIPINQALAVARQITDGPAGAGVHIGPTAFLGVETTSLRRYAGAAVVNVVADSPAAGAGLGYGDIIESVDGASVDSPATLGDLMAPHHPNDVITLGWSDRFGRSHIATVTLGQGPPA